MDVPDAYLATAARMPLATVGELLMRNFAVGDLDLAAQPEGFWVTLSWSHAYQLAEAVLREWAFTEAQIRWALDENVEEGREDGFGLLARRRIHDVHRIRMALHLLYPEQPELRDAWLRSPQARLGHVSALEAMCAGHSTDVRRLAEVLVGEW